MTVSHLTTADTGRPSQLLAAEIRAAMGRTGVRQLELARRIGRSHTWVGRRVSLTADVDMTLEDAVAMAKALGVSAEGLLLAVLPRLDSNQQPSGYPYMLVTRLADVVDLGAERLRRAS